MVKVAPICRAPPPKETLISKILYASEFRKSRDEDVSALEELLDRLINKKKSADTGFLIQVLHIVNENDEIFASNYTC